MHSLGVIYIHKLQQVNLCSVGQPRGGSRDSQIHFVSRVYQQEEEQEETSANNTCQKW